MDDAAYIALAAAVFAGISAMFSPIIVSLLTSHQRQREKQQDYARQDLVAQRLEERDRASEKRSASIEAKVDQVHVLSNSNYTLAKQDSLASMRRELILMKELAIRDEAEGRPSSPVGAAAIAETERAIEKLKAEIDERLRQAAVAEEERLAAVKRSSIEIELRTSPLKEPPTP